MAFMDNIPKVSGSRGRRRKIAPAGGAVVYQVVVCRVCGCKKCPVTSAPTPKKGDEYKLRHHKCSKCGNNFKSIEKI